VGVTLVTGGSGFIGSHVARALLERGDRVRVTVRARSRLDNLEGLDVERAQCDLLDRRQVRCVREGVDRLFHCAGLTSPRADADAHLRVNVQGTRILLEEALAFRLRRGDVYRPSTDIVRRFLRREIPVHVEGTVNVVAARALFPLPRGAARRPDRAQEHGVALGLPLDERPSACSAGRRGPHEECLEQTVAWYREPHEVRPAGTRQPLALRARRCGALI